MGRYFGREPRYSQQEAEAQAKAAIEAAVSKGRPPADEWKGLANKMGDINRELATRPPVEVPAPPPLRRQDPERPRPRVVSDILRPRPAPPEPPPPEAPLEPAAPPARKRPATGVAKAGATKATKATVKKTPVKKAVAKKAVPKKRPG